MVQRNQELLGEENKVSVKAEGGVILKGKTEGEAGILENIQVSGLGSWVDGSDFPVLDKRSRSSLQGVYIER